MHSLYYFWLLLASLISNMSATRFLSIHTYNICHQFHNNSVFHKRLRYHTCSYRNNRYLNKNREFHNSSVKTLKSLARKIHSLIQTYIRKTPKVVFCGGALKEALRLRARTVRVSIGSITPSSHNLQNKCVQWLTLVQIFYNIYYI